MRKVIAALILLPAHLLIILSEWIWEDAFTWYLEIIEEAYIVKIGKLRSKK